MDTTSLLDEGVYDETADCQSTGSMKKRREDGMVWDLLDADTLRGKKERKKKGDGERVKKRERKVAKKTGSLSFFPFTEKKSLPLGL